MVSGAPAWMQGVAAIGTLAITLLVALRLIPDTPLNPTPNPTGNPAVNEETMARSVVQVQIMANGELQGWGSGTVISDDGLILTNAHVATPSDIDADQLIIAVTQEADQPPVPSYEAEVVAADSVLDLAIIQIVRNTGGGPYDGALEPLAIGDSDAVTIGDEIIILGYPSVGGRHDHPDHRPRVGLHGQSHPGLARMDQDRCHHPGRQQRRPGCQQRPARSSGCPPSWAPVTRARSWTAAS